MTMLTVCFAGLWAFVYLYISGMACAFSNNANCGVSMPWQLSGEDLQFMVLIPGAIFLMMAILSVLLWRK